MSSQSKQKNNPKMNQEKLKYIYGPVPSWRLGSSLGMDLLSQEEKICSFDCIYCQLGRMATYTIERKLYVSKKEIIRELETLPEIKIDYITFSGRGEPTLAENLGQVIKSVKTIRRKPIAVLTNSSLMNREDVRSQLSLADFVIAKFDAYSQKSFREINKPAPQIEFSNVITGIKQFRKNYSKKLALQIMFVEENKNKAAEIMSLINDIKPDEIQINTPLRPCSVKPLSREEIFKIKEYFSLRCESVFGKNKINIVSVYDTKAHKEVIPISDKDTLIRRGKRN